MSATYVDTATAFERYVAQLTDPWTMRGPLSSFHSSII